jgi:putative transposase
MRHPLRRTLLARAERIALRTAERWVQRYRCGGLAGLAHQPRADRGRRAVAAELLMLIEGLALQTPPPTVATIQRRVAVVAAERGWAAPSYGTVYAIVHALDPGLVTLAHDGAKAYRERFDLLHRREADGPNAIWQADHT